MQVRFFCPECGKKLSAPASAAGRAGRCPRCRASFVAPAESSRAKTESAREPEVAARPPSRGTSRWLLATVGTVAAASLVVGLPVLYRARKGDPDRDATNRVSAPSGSSTSSGSSGSSGAGPSGPARSTGEPVREHLKPQRWWDIGGSPLPPKGLVATAAGEVFVWLVKYPRGQEIFRFDARGERVEPPLPIDVKRPVDIASAPSGELFVLTSPLEVVRISADGEVVSRWKPRQVVQRLAVAPAGSVHCVSGSGDYDLDEHEPDGGFVARRPLAAMDCRFCLIRRAQFSPEGRLHVVAGDARNEFQPQTVHRFAGPDLAYAGPIGGVRKTSDGTVSADGAVYVAVRKPPAVHELTPDGEMVAEWLLTAPNASETRSATYRTLTPYLIAAGPGRLLYMVPLLGGGSNPYRIYRYRLDAEERVPRG